MTAFEKIYRKTIPLWGDVISIADGRIINETNGFYSDTLITRWDNVEKQVGNQDELNALMAWAIYQQIHKEAYQKFIIGEFIIYPGALDKVEIENKFLSNLYAPGWEKELRRYNNNSD